VKALGLPVNGGIWVGDVIPVSPAAKAGLRGSTRVVTDSGDKMVRFDGWQHSNMVGGDIIVAVNGRPLHTEQDLANVLRTVKPGDVLALSIVRGRRPIELRVTAGPRGQQY
jgi:S1-C subfamily serine protease